MRSSQSCAGRCFYCSAGPVLTWLWLSESYNSLNFKILRAQMTGLTNTASVFQELLPCSNQHMGGMFLCCLNPNPVL